MKSYKNKSESLSFKHPEQIIKNLFIILYLKKFLGVLFIFICNCT